MPIYSKLPVLQPKNKPMKSITTPLLELGLNKYEAKVYLTLLGEGISTAKNISDITGIPYGKVYEIIQALTRKGFCVILPEKPMKSQAISPNEALITAKKKMEEKFGKIEKKVNEELEPLYNKSKKFEDPRGTVQVIQGRPNIIRKIDDFILKTKKTIHIQCSSNTLSRLILHKENLQFVKGRGVEIIIGSTMDNGIKEEAKTLNFCDIRKINDTSCCFMSFDGKDALMIEPIPDDTSIVYGRDKCLYINSEAYIKLFDGLFVLNVKKKKNVYEDLKE